ncbi:carbohydrate binding domain-containing protein [Paenibacillus luteus]|uniref:carbohydrate binding domain-containing protein n=1 Tax=Paenibacillus luteus TaxID=2545753 RepID=UPI00114461C2|nr:carbohydrate binding domain-containing protein [Paenibacillus luteus]
MRSKLTASYFYYVMGFSFIVMLVVLFSTPTSAYAANYYISNNACSNENTGNSGTLTAGNEGPWCDFTNVNAKTFAAGDTIYLERGGSWTQEFKPIGGTGTSSSWIVVDAYGTGNRPVIRGNSNATDKTLTLMNADFWEVRNLEFSHAGIGPQFLYSTTGHQGIIFRNNYIHSMVGGPNAIAMQVRSADIAATPSSGQWLVKDVEISHNEIGPTTSYGIVVMHNNSAAPTSTFQNVLVKNNELHDISAKALVFMSTKNSYWIDNRIDKAANANQSGGTTASFLFGTQNMTIANNLFLNTPDTGSTDQSAIDNEGKNYSNNFRGNYFANNYGGALEWLLCNCVVPDRFGTDFNSNNEVIGNTFVRNGGGAIWATSDTGQSTGTIKDSLFFENEFIIDESKFIEWSEISNNVSIPAVSKINNAANEFGATGTTGNWSYQLFDGNSYTSLTYDLAENWYGTAGGHISQFNLSASDSADHWISNAWTAPYNGVISIRGQVFKNEIGGDGALARVTKNGQVIWPAANAAQLIASDDLAGYATNLDAISVTQNDVIRFEVNNGGTSAVHDVISWAPTVAFTSGGHDSASDSMVPGAITDLAISSIDHNKAVLTWTASGRDGATGTANRYDIRYSTSPITDANWSSATRLGNRPFPESSGTVQTVTVPFLTADSLYYFAMKTVNDIPNESLLSNVANASTLADITELVNPGFEDGIAPWAAQGASIDVSNIYAHSGNYSLWAFNRTDTWAGANQDITSLLNVNGQGSYSFGVWAKYADSSAGGFVTLNITDSAGSRWFTAPITMISHENFTEIIGVENITWTGTVSSAIMYFQSDGSLEDVYLDDFFVNKVTESSNESTLVGVDQIYSGAQFSLTYGLKDFNVNGFENIYAQDLIITFDPAKLDFIDAISLKSGFAVLSRQVVEPGKVRVIAAAQGTGFAPNGDWLKFTFKAKPSTQIIEAVTALSDIVVANSQGDEFEVDGISHTIQIQKRGDLNADSRISIGDLAIVGSYYGKTSADANWNSTYMKADYNQDNVIDIADMSAIAQLILN